MLIDSLNKEPVAFASISAGSFVCYSDQDGIFSTEELPDGPILISRLGYQSIEILKSELTSKVVLSPKRYSISEIEISGNAEAFELGYHELKTFGFSKMKNKYMAVLVQSPRKRCRIENVLVHIRKNRKGTDFVIGLFSVNDRGVPGDLIFSKEHKAPSGRNLLEVSVAEVNLEIPEDGIFVAIKSIEPAGIGEEQKDYGFVRFTKLSVGNVSYFQCDNQWFENDFKELDYKLTYKIGLELAPY